jgi:hypothetical protein
MQQTKRDATDTGIDPFRTSITIASLCNLIYRRNFMPENSIPIIPSNGFNPNILSSNKCDKWLQYLAQKNVDYLRVHDVKENIEAIDVEKFEKEFF